MSRNGSNYRIYMFVHPDSRYGQARGLTGLQVGIYYSETGPNRGLRVDGWHRCTALDFPMTSWPASGSGNTMTWGRNQCQLADLIPFGWFDVTVYTSTIFAVTAHPATNEAKIANCEAAEASIPVNSDRLGWISFEGARRSEESAGCNPMLRDCRENAVPLAPTVPVEPVTWSRIKAGFLREK